MINSNPTETRIATVYKDENDIIIITMKNCGKVDEFDILDINLVLRTKANQKPALKLFDARAIWAMDKKAKEKAKQEQKFALTKARAIVVSDIIKATLMRFLQSFDKYDYPQQIFTNKDDAYNWLLTFKND